MDFSQMEHLVNIPNVFYSNATWFATLCIYFLPTHPPIYQLTTYLPITNPPTHNLPTYIFSPSYNLPTHLPTYLHITYLLVHPFTYLNLTTNIQKK